MAYRPASPAYCPPVIFELRAHKLNPLALVFGPVDSSDAEELASLRAEAMRDSLERIGRFDAVQARRRFLDSFSAEYTRAIVLTAGGLASSWYGPRAKRCSSITCTLVLPTRT